MTHEEAKKIYDDWLSFIEFADKFKKVFTKIPESFLPYSVSTIEEALNIIAKDFFYAGDKETANHIQNVMIYQLLSAINDKEAMDCIKRDLDLMYEDPELRDIKLEKLKECRDLWLKTNIKRNKLTDLQK